jgi:DNA invertase Pin-like site-specific DNA recombinase
MKTIAYIRVSTVRQDLDNQRLEIESYCTKNGTHVDEWVEIEISSRRNRKDRLIDGMIAGVRQGDTIIVSELSRIGRSISEVVDIVNTLIKKKVRLIAIKQNIVLNGKQDMASKMIVTMFALMAEIERDLISERTKMGLARARANGKRLGNPRAREMADERKTEAHDFALSMKPVFSDLMVRNLSQRQMVKELNDRGIPARQGGRWGLRQVQMVMGRMG